MSGLAELTKRVNNVAAVDLANTQTRPDAALALGATYLADKPTVIVAYRRC
jgi:hypothetical protein